ncbi:ABC transporter substrate-binding protein [Actinomadura sp. LOL_016]|uniref:ABC transporter substrate-binding protein n=1 Tax=unclassified Actinomadura TaxID=2626254 RepID=UPI003A7FEFA8
MLSRKPRLIPLIGLGVAVVLALAGCSGGDAGAAGASSNETRTVTDVIGEKVEIPVAPQRIVALDEPATLNLLSLGIKPANAFQAWKTVVPAKLIESLGIETHQTADYYPKLEEVAALRPDLIVFSSDSVESDEVPDYASIAPTLRAPYSVQPTELARAWGEYFGKPERAKAVDEGLTNFAAEIAAEQPDPALSLSALQSYGGSGDASLYHMDAGNSLHSVIDGAGFDRPKLQSSRTAGGAEHGGWAPFSPETLSDHDAGIIAIMSSPQYTPKGITGLPLFPSLKGRAVEVDGDFWSGGSLFYAYWVLCDLQDFVGGDITPGGAGDITERWKAFTAMIEKA